MAQGRDERPVGGADADVVAVGGEPRHDRGDGVLADAADGDEARLGVRARVPESFGEPPAAGGDAGRAEEVGGGDHERAVADLVAVAENLAELAAQGGPGAGLELQVGRRGGDCRGVLEYRFHPGRPGARAAPARREPPAPAAQAIRQHFDHAGARHDGAAHREQGLPVARLDHRLVVSPAAGRVVGVAARDLELRQTLQRLDGIVEVGRAERVAGAVRGAPLHAVAPALDGAVDDRGGLAVVEVASDPLCGDDGLKVGSVGHCDDVPVVEGGELGRRPLDVVARAVILAADVIAVDRGLVPVDVQEGVAERGGARRGQRLGGAARREAALAFDDVHPRRVGAVEVGRTEGEAQRRGQPDAGGAGGEADEWGGRRRVSVEGLRLHLAEQGCVGDRVASEAEEVLETQLVAELRGQKLGRSGAGDLRAQGPHGVQAEGLVAGGVGDHVGVRAQGVCKVVVEAVEQQAGHETAGRDGTAGVPRRRHVVEHQGAQGPVDLVEVGEGGELGFRQR